MPEDPDDLEKLLKQVADGDSVDWDGLERAAPDDETLALLRQLRLISELSEVHRSQVDELPALDLAATGPAGWPGGSWPPPRRPHASDVAGGHLGTWGHLLLVRKIGEGTYGEVYHAHDTWLDHPVALKLLKPEAESSVQPSDLLHEARKLARVRHPNVVAVHGADRHEGRVGFWMDFVDGETLAARLAKGPMSAGEAVSVGQEVCRALAAVHRANIIHRDVKAQNVMRANDGGRIILMDFGAGQFVDDPAVRRRAQGTPLYLAPELLRGEDATPRSDIYAVGVLLFHLVTRRFPVDAPSPTALREAHTRGERRWLRDERPDLPDSFIAIVERASDPIRDRRYASAGEMEAALTGEAGATAATTSMFEGRASRETLQWPRRAAVAAALALATVAVLTLIGGITSILYYRAFGIAGSFQQEAWVSWPMWGLRALLAPMVLAGGVAAVGYVFLGRLYRFALTLPLVSPLLRPVAERVSTHAGWLRSADTASVAALLLLAQCALLGLTLWWFSPMFGSFDSLILQKAGDLTPLSPANLDEQAWLRQVLSVELLLVTVAWGSLLKGRSKTLQDGWVGIAGGTALTLFMLILLLVPYRIVWHNEHERVSYRQETCYLLGERGGEGLLFCPLRHPPRNQVIRLDDPGLAREGSEENMFSQLGVFVN
jgi:hypothetical protein